MKHFGDITKLSGCHLPIVDCITGGSPCQDLSVAGKRAGIDGERSGLFMEQIRIVKEMRDADRATGRTGVNIRPRFMVWENVPGAFSSNKGKDFQAVLTEIVRIAEPDSPDVPMPEKGKWPKSGCLYDDMGGWSVAWRVHDAQFWGVPQRRKRIAVVADFGGLSAPEILFERKGLSRDIESCAKEGEGIAGSLTRSTAKTDNGLTKNYVVQEGQTYCLDTKWFNSCADKSLPLVSTQYKDPPVVAGGFDGCVSSKAGSVCFRLEQVGTLDAVKPKHVLCLNDQGERVMNVSENVSGALRAEEHGHQPLVYGSSAYGAYKKGITTLRAQGGDNGGGSENIVASTTSVRRLTPLECERLQGFPDGWTYIGDWVDSNGKKHKAADSPRYKALGNSIALPFWFYLLRRISAQYERPATLGSLFDGIGGFPLCWERCNGKGTALWASEIEEFPMAVTKKRFSGE